MRAHTPGPWRYGPHLSPSENHRGYYIVSESSNGWAHATVQPGDEDGELGEANARLIAAAPDLLDALSRTRGQWIGSVNADACLAALAKAGYPQPPKPEIAA